MTDDYKWGLSYKPIERPIKQRNEREAYERASRNFNRYMIELYNNANFP